MDMITAIELQDAIANIEKVQARVLEVATIVSLINKELQGGRTWRLITFLQVSGRRRGSETEEEPTIHAYLKTKWDDRPVTRKYGDPRDDEEALYDSQHVMERRVSFPTRYLWTDDWLDEVQRQRWQTELWFAEHHADDLQKSIAESKNHTSDLIDKRKGYIAKANELKEKLK